MWTKGSRGDESETRQVIEQCSKAHGSSATSYHMGLSGQDHFADHPGGNKTINKNTTRTCGKWLESAIMKFRMRQVHIYTTCEASPNLSILRTALEKTDLSWIFASAMVAKEYRVEKLGKAGKLVGMLGISERIPSALENVGDTKNANETCAAEITASRCPRFFESNFQGRYEVTQIHLVDSLDSTWNKVAPAHPALWTLQFWLWSLMPFPFESQSDLIVPPTLVDRGPATRNLHCIGGWRPTRDPLTGRRVQWMEQCELMRKKIPWARLEKRPKFISMPWRST